MIITLCAAGAVIGVALLFGQMIVTEIVRGLDDVISLWHKRRKERKTN